MTWRNRKDRGNQRSPSPQMCSRGAFKDVIQEAMSFLPMAWFLYNMSIRVHHLACNQKYKGFSSFSCTVTFQKKFKEWGMFILIFLYASKAEGQPIFLSAQLASSLLPSENTNEFAAELCDKQILHHKKCVLNFMWGFNSSSRKAVKYFLALRIPKYLSTKVTLMASNLFVQTCNMHL